MRALLFLLLSFVLVAWRSADLALAQNLTCEDAKLIDLEPVSDGSVEFLGRNRDFAACGSPEPLRIVDALTVEAWVYFTDIATYQHVVSKGGNFLVEDPKYGNQGDAYECAIFESRMYSRFNINGTFQFLQGRTVMKEQQWYFLAWTFDGQKLSYYLDGVLDASITHPGKIADQGDLYIGREAFYDGAYLSAIVDSIRIWNVARSPEEIMEDLMNSSTIDSDSLVAFWDGSTDFVRLLDQTENQNHCRFFGEEVNVLAYQGWDNESNIPIAGDSRETETFYTATMTFRPSSAGMAAFPNMQIDGVDIDINPSGLVLSDDGLTMYVSVGSRGTGGIYKVALSDIYSPGVSGTVTLLVASVPLGTDRNAPPGTEGVINSPIGLALDETRGVLYAADLWYNRVYRVNTATGSVDVLAGNGTYGFQDGSRFEASFQAPRDVILSPSGEFVYVADTDNNRIRKIHVESGNVSTLAGGFFGYLDGSYGRDAMFAYPSGIAISPDGKYVFVADSSNFRIRRVSTEDGATSTIAGSDRITSATDGVGPSAGFAFPSALAVSKEGENLYLVDMGAQAIRKIGLSTARVTTIGGSLGSDGGFQDSDPCKSAIPASFNSPAYVEVHEANGQTILLVSDQGNSLVRLLTNSSSAECSTDEGGGGISTLGIVMAAVFGGLGMLFIIVASYFSYRVLLNRAGFVKRFPPREDEEVTVAITDLEGSTVLWESFPEHMGKSLALHDRLLRNLLYRHFGYESYTEGDSFTCVFHTAQDAINWSIDVQRELLTAPWIPEIVDQKVVPGLVTDKDGYTLFRGLRVRIGINTGLPLSRSKNASNGRYFYEGSMLETAKHIGNAPAGGQIIMGESVLKEDIALSEVDARIVHMGEHELCSGSKPVNLYMVTPKELVGRELMFPKLSTYRALSPCFFDAPCALPSSEKASVTIAFMEVDHLAELELWNKKKTEEALELLQLQCIKPLLQFFHGYECDSLHGKFVFAFKSPIFALLFAASLQVQAMELDWDTDLLESEDAGEMYVYDSKGKEKLVYRGLQLNIGLCEGKPNDCQPHATTGRALYTGPVMNRAARILGMASGGQILLSSSCLLRMDTNQNSEHMKALANLCTFKHMGVFALKGLRGNVPILQAIVMPLEDRPQRPTKARAVAPPPSREGNLSRMASSVMALLEKLEYFASLREDDFLDGDVASCILKDLWPTGIAFLRANKNKEPGRIYSYLTEGKKGVVRWVVQNGCSGTTTNSLGGFSDSTEDGESIIGSAQGLETQRVDTPT